MISSTSTGLPVGMSSRSSGSLLPSHDAFGDQQKENPDERELIPTGSFFNNALVSCPINSMAFAVGHLADFQGANDEHI
jgi:hypothetical protein